MISWAAGDEEEFMELLWQNGLVVMKSQRSPRKSSPSPDDRPHPHPLDLIPAAALRAGSPPPYHHHHDPSLQQQNDADNNDLFIQEDEMSTWLLSDFCSDLLLPATPAATSAVPSRPSRPPPAVPPPKRLDSFSHFSRLNSPRDTPADEATVVASSDTPMVTRTSENAARVGAESASAVVLDAVTRDQIATSSSGASSASTEPVPPAKSQEVSPSKAEADAPDLRRRKARDGDQSNDGEDVQLLSSDAKRVLRSSSSTKRSRAAEVHNLSERRRRDRINEKLRALQELIPHCNKADKASMLDEAIGYLKSLQMQVQMMSTRCGMMPMMYPGMQLYMPRMGMGMNRPMIHFPNVFIGSTLPTTAAGPHMNSGFCFPAFQMPSHIPAPDLSRMTPTNQADAMLSSSALHNSNSPRMPGLMDPYQQYFGLQHMHLPFQQSQANTSSSSKPTTSKAGGTCQKRLTVPSILQKRRLQKPEFCSVEINRGFESERAEGKPSGCVAHLLPP